MKRILLIAGFWCIVLQAQAMTQAEFVQSLKNNHPFFAQQSLSSQIKQVEKQAARENEDWIIHLKGNHRNEDVPDGLRVGPATDSLGVTSITSEISPQYFDQLKETEIKFSATRKLVDTGSRIVFGHSWVDTNRNKDILDTTFNNFTLDYTYPLLRNKDGINDRLLGDMAQITIEQDVLERLEKEEKFILSNLGLFIELAYAQEQRLINEQRLSLAKQELDLVQEKYDASVVDKVDVLLQEDAYQSAQLLLLQAKQDLILLRQEIAITLALDVEEIVAKTDLYKVYTFPNLNLKKYLLNTARALKTIDLDHKRLKRQLHSFENKSQAILDFNIGLASVGFGESSNYSDSLDNQNIMWNVGLNLSYPLGGIKSSADISRAKIKIQKLFQSKRDKLIELHIEAINLKEKIKLMAEMLKSNQVQISIAKALTVEEKAQYANGNGQASNVILAQNKEQSAQLDFAQTAKNYQKAVLEYKATLDILAP